MAPLFALSIHHFVNSVGADVGFASIIGLAVLVLLYFAQARETASLRAHAQEAAERIQQLEGRVAQLLRAQSSAQAQAAQATSAGATAVGRTAALSARSVAAATVGAGVVASRGPARQGALAPSAPAGVGAPALADATRLVPLPTPAAANAAAQSPAPAVAGAPPSRVASGVVGAAGSGTGGPAAPGGGTATVTVPARTPGPAGPDRITGPGGSGGRGGADRFPGPGGPSRIPGPAGPGGVPGPDDIPDATFFEAPGPAPATVAGAINGATHPPAATPRPVSAATSPPPRGQQRPGSARRRQMPAPPPRRQGGRPSRGRRFLLIVAPLVVVVGIAVAVVLATRSSTPHGTTKTTAHTTNADRRRAARRNAVNPANVTVAVLNGTSQNGLATALATKLAAMGYKHGTPQTAADQTHTTTIVAYLPNFRRDAVAVANSLKLPSSSVQPVDQTSQSVACPNGACAATVVVTVGTDLANTQ